MKERYFYHSFPSRGGEGLPATYSKRLKILSSIANHGLLLAPEDIEWRENLSNGTLGQPLRVFQKRVCFTELAPAELGEHALRYGPFALEFDIQTLRRLGGMPVFYIPRSLGTDIGFEGIGPTLLARLAEIQKVLTRLVQIEELVNMTPDKDQLLSVTRYADVMAQLWCSGGAAEDLLSYLNSGTQKLPMLLNTIKALSGLFYPTEDQGDTDLLGYYREREWRIIDAWMRKGQRVSQSLSNDEVQLLLDIDHEYFGTLVKFPTGEYTRAEQSQMLRYLNEEPVLAYARRLIVPEAAINEARHVVAEAAQTIDVVPLESVVKDGP